MFDFLDRIARRLRWRQRLTRGARFVVVGSLVAALFVAIAAWVPVAYSTAIAIAILSIAAIAALGTLFGEPYSRSDAAQIADLVLGTHSLFVTAQELSQTTGEHECIQQAHDIAATADPVAIVPIPKRSAVRAAITAIIAVAGVVIAPHASDKPGTITDENAHVAAAHLDKAAKQLEKARDKDKAQAEKIQRLARQLRKAEISKRAAMEQLGEIKRQLRTQRLQSQTSQLRAARALSEAGRSLNHSQLTRQLGRLLNQGANSTSNPEFDGRRAEAQKVLRQLAKLDRNERQQAAESLDQAAQRARQSGNADLAQALEAAAQAIRNGTPSEIGDAAAQLARATAAQNPNKENNSNRVDSAIENAQAALDGRPAQISPEAEASITNATRQWNSVPNGNAQNAGVGHNDEESNQEGGPEGHQDADRFGPERRELWNEEYRELYEAALLNSGGRIASRVRGERTGDGKVQLVQGGRQAPGTEKARSAIAQLPVSYAKEAQEAIGSQTIPPGYRTAVRTYFDADR